jgi:hypothetical protein
MRELNDLAEQVALLLRRQEEISEKVEKLIERLEALDEIATELEPNNLID